MRLIPRSWYQPMLFAQGITQMWKAETRKRWRDAAQWHMMKMTFDPSWHGTLQLVKIRCSWAVLHHVEGKCWGCPLSYITYWWILFQTVCFWWNLQGGSSRWLWKLQQDVAELEASKKRCLQPSLSVQDMSDVDFKTTTSRQQRQLCVLLKRTRKSIWTPALNSSTTFGEPIV